MCGLTSRSPICVRTNFCGIGTKGVVFWHIFHSASMNIHCIANRRVGGDSTHKFVSFSYTSFLGATNTQIFNWAESFHRCKDYWNFSRFDWPANMQVLACRYAGIVSRGGAKGRPDWLQPRNHPPSPIQNTIPQHPRSLYVSHSPDRWTTDGRPTNTAQTVFPWNRIYSTQSTAPDPN